MKRSIRRIAIASLAFAMIGCQSAGKKTATGAGIGAAAGAGLGTILGNQKGGKAKGAILGAGLGAAIGGAIGNKLDRQAAELQQVADTQRTDEGILTKLKGDILFDTEKATIKPDAATNLNQIAGILKKYPENKLTIVGHTDATGTEPFNQDLSEERAQSVMQHLVAAGFPKDRVKIVGMGEARPVAPNESDDGRAKNRRVELQITMDEAQPTAKQ